MSVTRIRTYWLRPTPWPLKLDLFKEKGRAEPPPIEADSYLLEKNIAAFGRMIGAPYSRKGGLIICICDSDIFRAI